jgi:N-term cysteine-rich ER, FAM69
VRSCKRLIIDCVNDCIDSYLYTHHVCLLPRLWIALRCYTRRDTNCMYLLILASFDSITSQVIFFSSFAHTAVNVAEVALTFITKHVCSVTFVKCKQYSQQAITGTLCEELCSRKTLILSQCTLDFLGYRVRIAFLLMLICWKLLISKETYVAVLCIDECQKKIGSFSEA